jgi:hypothetical protein
VNPASESDTAAAETPSPDPRADLLRIALKVMKVSQAELCRRTGFSAKDAVYDQL